MRSAKVLLPSKKIIGRPLNLLYPIECSGKEQGPKKANQKLSDNQEDDTTGRRQPTRQAAMRALHRIKQQLNDDTGC